MTSIVLIALGVVAGFALMLIKAVYSAVRKGADKAQEYANKRRSKADNSDAPIVPDALQREAEQAREEFTSMPVN